MTPEQKQRIEQIRECVEQIKRATLHGPVPLKTTMQFVIDCDFLLSIAEEQEAAPITPSLEAKEIVETINKTAISLAVCRHGLIREAEDDELTLPDEVEEEIIQDVLDCLTGEETGCLDPEELNAENCAVLMVRDRLNRVATSMRSLCVEKVSEILNRLMIELPPVSDSYLKGQGWNSALAQANNEIIRELESLSLQEQEK